MWRITALVSFLTLLAHLAYAKEKPQAVPKPVSFKLPHRPPVIFFPGQMGTKLFSTISNYTDYPVNLQVRSGTSLGCTISPFVPFTGSGEEDQRAQRV